MSSLSHPSSPSPIREAIPGSPLRIPRMQNSISTYDLSFAASVANSQEFEESSIYLEERIIDSLFTITSIICAVRTTPPLVSFLTVEILIKLIPK